ncbi:hypothetical protein Hamer_G022682, partial [Homarus americanus]
LEDFTNRIMVSLTAQLVLAALFTSTTQSSVKTPYLKLIDVWYAAVITFCFVIVITQTLVNVVFNSTKLPKVVVRAVGFKMSDMEFGKPVHSITIQRGGEKTTPPGSTHTNRLRGRRPAQEVARRYNSVARIVILAVVATFVIFYGMMAMGVI